MAFQSNWAPKAKAGKKQGMFGGFGHSIGSWFPGTDAWWSKQGGGGGGGTGGGFPTGAQSQQSIQDQRASNDPSGPQPVTGPTPMPSYDEFEAFQEGRVPSQDPAAMPPSLQYEIMKLEQANKPPEVAEEPAPPAWDTLGQGWPTERAFTGEEADRFADIWGPGSGEGGREHDIRGLPAAFQTDSGAEWGPEAEYGIWGNSAGARVANVLWESAFEAGKPIGMIIEAISDPQGTTEGTFDVFDFVDRGMQALMQYGYTSDEAADLLINDITTMTETLGAGAQDPGGITVETVQDMLDGWAQSNLPGPGASTARYS